MPQSDAVGCGRFPNPPEISPAFSRKLVCAAVSSVSINPSPWSALREQCEITTAGRKRQTSRRRIGFTPLCSVGRAQHLFSIFPAFYNISISNIRRLCPNSGKRIHRPYRIRPPLNFPSSIFIAYRPFCHFLLFSVSCLLPPLSLLPETAAFALVCAILAAVQCSNPPRQNSEPRLKIRSRILFAPESARGISRHHPSSFRHVSF